MSSRPSTAAVGSSPLSLLAPYSCRCLCHPSNSSSSVRAQENRDADRHASQTASKARTSTFRVALPQVLHRRRLHARVVAGHEVSPRGLLLELFADLVAKVLVRGTAGLGRLQALLRAPRGRAARSSAGLRCGAWFMMCF